MKKSLRKTTLQYFARVVLLLIMALASLSGCDGGLDPAMTASQKAIFGGTVHYVGGASSFPPQDSVRFLTVVGFKEIPRDTNIVNTISTGDAYFLTTSLPYGKDSSYTIEVPKTPVTLKYVCVAQQYGPNFFSDWRVVGIYSTTGDFTPTSLQLISGQIRNTVNIDVDFTKLPPQPFIR